MSRISVADAEQAGKRKKTRREVFLAERELGALEGAAQGHRTPLSSGRPRPSAPPAPKQSVLLESGN